MNEPVNSRDKKRERKRETRGAIRGKIEGKGRVVNYPIDATR